MIWFTSADGFVVLGPYLSWEIGPQLRALKWLGHPDRTVYRVQADSLHGAKAKVASMLRRNREN